MPGRGRFVIENPMREGSPRTARRGRGAGRVSAGNFGVGGRLNIFSVRHEKGTQT